VTLQHELGLAGNVESDGGGRSVHLTVRRDGELEKPADHGIRRIHEGLRAFLEQLPHLLVDLDLQRGHLIPPSSDKLLCEVDGRQPELQSQEI